MSPGLAARTAIVCALICSALAHAQAPGARPGPAAPAPAAPPRPIAKRPVAIVDLTGDEKTSKLARELDTILRDHAVLYSPQENFELVGVYGDDDQINIKNAERSRDLSLGALGTSVTSALSAAQTGEEQLHRVVPTAHVRAIYADLAFAVGAARLGDKKPAEAAVAFALSDRLVPGRKIDDNTTTPDVIAAFEAARKEAATAAKVPVMIKGSGRAWVDGKEMGPPGVYDLTVGAHVVWLTGPDRMTAGQQVVIETGKSNTVEIKDDPAPTRTKIRRARLALRNAVDPAARAVAIKQLAQLVKVGDAVLIGMTNDKVVVQTWRDQAPGFSAFYEYRNEKASDLLEPLAPTPKPQVVEVPWIPPIETPWYRKRKVQMSALATVVVIAGIILASSIEGNTPLNKDPVFR